MNNMSDKLWGGRFTAKASEWVDVSELCDSEEEAHFWWATNFTDLIFSCEKVSFQPNNEIFKTINAD